MPAPSLPARHPSTAVVLLYNAVPAVVWSVLALGPLAVACYRWVARPWLWGAVAVSLLAYAWPAAWLRRLQLSRHATVYRRVGVATVGRFVQNGGFVNALLRRHYPAYRPLPVRGRYGTLRSATYQQERFHWAALVFFLLVSGYLAGHDRWGWALGLTVVNVAYNLYPIWLQQYVRLRLHR